MTGDLRSSGGEGRDAGNSRFPPFRDLLKSFLRLRGKRGGEERRWRGGGRSAGRWVAGKPKVELSLACWGPERRPYRRGRESRSSVGSSVWAPCVCRPGWCASFGRWLGTVCVCVYRLRQVGLFRVCAALIKNRASGVAGECVRRVRTGEPGACHCAVCTRGRL